MMEAYPGIALITRSTDALLPVMQLLGLDLRSGVSTSLTTWTSATDPSPGNLKLQLIQGSGLIQFELIKDTSRIYATGGLFFMSTEFDFTIVSGSEPSYFSYSV
jgi:hypothetical protein